MRTLALKHKHHIIPKHAGGTDDSSNLVELTVEEHAEAHRVLYEQYGRWQDKLAWLGLAGIIDDGERQKLLHSYAMLSRRGIPQTPEHIEKRIAKIRGDGNGMYGKTGELNPMFGKTGKLSPHYGKKHTEETKKKISKSLVGRSYEDLHGPEKALKIKSKLSKPKTEEHKKKLSKPKSLVVTRIHDRKPMALSNYMNWVKQWH